VPGKSPLTYLLTNLHLLTQKFKLTSEDLVQEDLDMVNGQWLLGYNDTMKVTLHQFSANIAVILSRTFQIIHLQH